MNSYIIEEGQTIFDVAMVLYKKPLGIFQIRDDNPDLITDFDVDLLAGDVILYDADKVRLSQPIETKTKKVNVIDENIIYVVVSEGQNIIDLAIQMYGSVDGIFQLMNDNQIQNVNIALQTGIVLKFDKTQIIDPDVLKVYNKKGVIVNTGDNPLEGVGYWYIENDNVVS
jgi:hypothetical protein